MQREYLFHIPGSDRTGHDYEHCKLYYLDGSSRGFGYPGTVLVYVATFTLDEIHEKYPDARRMIESMDELPEYDPYWRIRAGMGPRRMM